MKGLLAFLAFLAFIAVSCNASEPDLFFPNPRDTPGATNPDVTEANVHQTVCQSDWLNTIQPSASYIAELKAKQMAALQLKGDPSDYEEDHLVPKTGSKSGYANLCAEAT